MWRLGEDIQSLNVIVIPLRNIKPVTLKPNPAMSLQAANTIQAAHPDKPRPQVTALARVRTDVAVIPTATGNQLVRTPPKSASATLFCAFAGGFNKFGPKWAQTSQ